MKATKRFATIIFAGLMFSGSALPAPAQTLPKVGERAPNFKLSYFDGNDLKEVSLDQYRGKKNVVLAFFIFAFTGG